jgi:hypothetical protein
LTENFARAKDIFDSCQSHLLRTIIVNQVGIVCRALAYEKPQTLRIVALSIASCSKFLLDFVLPALSSCISWEKRDVIGPVNCQTRTPLIQSSPKPVQLIMSRSHDYPAHTV